MFVELGARIPVEDLIRGIIIQSGNDACVVVAEGLGGTVEGFVDLMNKRAKELGLGQSHFVNPDGLPDPPGQLMSALDLAKLRATSDQRLSGILSLLQRDGSFVWHNITPAQPRPGAGRSAGRGWAQDRPYRCGGLRHHHLGQTGQSAPHPGLNGLRYPQYHNDYFPNIKRAEEAGRVMDMAFREFRSYPVSLPTRWWASVTVNGGAQPTVPVTPWPRPLAVTMQVDSHAGMKTVLKPDPGLTAPIARARRWATMTVTAPDFPAMIGAGLCHPGGGRRQHLRRHVPVDPACSGRSDEGMARRTRRAASSPWKAAKAAASPPRSNAWPRPWKAAASPWSPRASRAVRRARRKSAGLLVEGEPGRWDPLTETLVGLCRARRSCGAHDRAGPAGGKWVISDRFSEFHLCLSGRRPRAWRAKPSAASIRVVLDDFKPDLTLMLGSGRWNRAWSAPMPGRARKPASRISTAISMKGCARPFSISPGAIPTAARDRRRPEPKTRWRCRFGPRSARVSIYKWRMARRARGSEPDDSDRIEGFSASPRDIRTSGRPRCCSWPCRPRASRGGKPPSAWLITGRPASARRPWPIASPAIFWPMARPQSGLKI